MTPHIPENWLVDWNLVIAMGIRGIMTKYAACYNELRTHRCISWRYSRE
jgi:hypothetical protein